jgi:hypothetical protein
VSLLSGPVVFIDDEIEQGESLASELLKAIQASGRPVLASASLPPTELRQEWFAHWQTLSFVVIDWDLSPGSNGAMGSSTLSGFERRKLFDFLEQLMAVIYCPVFIISREDVDDIRQQVKDNPKMLNRAGEVDTRIAAFPKQALMDDIVEHLTARVQASPALSVLRTWEQEFDAARNRLFLDFNNMEPDWPVYVWRTALDDHVDPAFELSSVISSNLLTRVNPVAFDDGIIQGHDAEVSGAAMRKVSQGRTFVDESRLSDRMVFPGDIFKLDPDNAEEVWINISPVCQTVLRPGAAGGEPEPVHLHLIRGRRVDVSSKSKFTKLESVGKGPTGDVIHTLLEEAPYHFEFRDASLRLWEDVKAFRIGRLLTPYVTRLQQKHSAYLQAEGLPRVSYDLYCDGKPS